MCLGTIMNIMSVLHFPASPDWNSLTEAGRAGVGRDSYMVLSEPPGPASGRLNLLCWVELYCWVAVSM